MRALALSSLLLLCACAAQTETADTQTGAADVPPVTVLGPGERCIPTSLIQNTEVQSAQVIDFRMRNGRTFRSTLPAACPGLGFERRFAYQTTVGQLCTVDTIMVLYTGGGAVPGATCRLGEFVPVEPAPAGDATG
jgi:hypothetical protein